MQTSINAFNRQDEHLLIRWRLLPLQAQRHSVFFSWRLVHGCRHSIPWKIQISHCKKNGDEAVFLPEYTPRFSSTFLLCDRGLQGIEVAEAFSVDGQLVEVAEGSSLAPVSHAGSEDALNAAEDAMLARSEFGIVGQKTATASRPPSYKSFLI
ncbi:hypothetical protein BJ741DRAFT_616513 [Chytriomyces cf. hyalinus JEL632]|nr:hypothetical protein BJ741DRAFT_616513 [Chytriomyces cf. hyalinus JEL632]